MVAREEEPFALHLKTTGNRYRVANKSHSWAWAKEDYSGSTKKNGYKVTRLKAEKFIRQLNHPRKECWRFGAALE
jgi:hypothetical protein